MEDFNVIGAAAISGKENDAFAQSFDQQRKNRLDNRHTIDPVAISSGNFYNNPNNTSFDRADTHTKSFDSEDPSHSLRVQSRLTMPAMVSSTVKKNNNKGLNKSTYVRNSANFSLIQGDITSGTSK